jgi:hypothetical protein
LKAGAEGATGWVYLGPTLHPVNAAMPIATAQTAATYAAAPVDLVIHPNMLIV